MDKIKRDESKEMTTPTKQQLKEQRLGFDLSKYKGIQKIKNLRELLI
jgi:hypothetical protein